MILALIVGFMIVDSLDHIEKRVAERNAKSDRKTAKAVPRK